MPIDGHSNPISPIEPLPTLSKQCSNKYIHFGDCNRKNLLLSTSTSLLFRLLSVTC
uniref:Uncharacterized protein n=1 Tax=Arundo donax TaxID=35708 RepID=A0A0A9E1E1_ARUDO